MCSASLGPSGFIPRLVAGQLATETGRFDRFRKHLAKIRHIVTRTAMVDGWGDVFPVGNIVTQVIPMQRRRQSGQSRQKQHLIRQFKRETGETQIDMHKVAAYAVSKGWTLPTPRSPIDLLARQFADAARQEMRYDTATGKPYRANHAVGMGSRGQYQWVWVDNRRSRAARHAEVSCTPKRANGGRRISANA